MSFDALLAVAVDDRLTGAQALELRRMIYSDGAIGRGEAEALIALNARVREADPAWTQLYSEALCDCLLVHSAPQDHVTPEEAAWLIAALSAPGAVKSQADAAALTKVLERAEAAPPELAAFARAIVDRIVLESADAHIDETDALLIRAILSASGGEGGFHVTRSEAEWVFELDAATSEAANAPMWTDVFIRAVANHLMAIAAPPALSHAQALRRERFLREPGEGVGGVFRRMLAGWANWRGVQALSDCGAHGYEALLQARENAMAAEAELAARLTEEEAGWLAERLLRNPGLTPNERALLAWLEVELPELPAALRALAREHGQHQVT